MARRYRLFAFSQSCHDRPDSLIIITVRFVQSTHTPPPLVLEMPVGANWLKFAWLRVIEAGRVSAG